MNEVTGPHFVPIVILCTLHAAAGFSVGLFTANSFLQRKSRPKRIVRLEESVRFYREGLEQISRQAKKLSALSSTHKSALPIQLAEAINALAKATREFQEHAKRIPRRSQPLKATQTTVPPPIAFRREEFPVISSGEMNELVSLSRGEADEWDPDLAKRHAYQVAQWMGRCAGSRLPAAEEFEKVMCYDISPNGISFYADDVQIGQAVVMAIGMDGALMFVLAEVMHRRVVNFRDQLTYLVGCRFQRRLGGTEDAELVDGYRRVLLDPIGTGT